MTGLNTDRSSCLSPFHEGRCRRWVKKCASRRWCPWFQNCRDNFETMGTIAYSHIFSPNVGSDLRGMVRDNSNDLYSNPSSTPIIVFQHNSFREGYFKG